MQQQPTTPTLKQTQLRRREGATVPRPLFYCALLILLVAAGVIVGVVVHNQPTSPPSLNLTSLHSLQSSESQRVVSKKPKFSTHLKFQKRSEQGVEPSETTEQQPSTEVATEKPKKPAKPHHFYHDKKKTDKDKEELGAKKNKKQ